LERLISDPLIWDGHLILGANFHIAEVPSYGVILEYIDREFNKLDKIQEDCDQPAQEIGQNNQNQLPHRPMEYFNSEIQLPLTENFPPVLSSTLDACPLNLENDQSLETLEPLENTGTKQFGSEIEIIQTKNPSEISLPVITMIGENCFPVAPVTLESSPQLLENGPQLLENSQQLEPLDENEAENLGSESKICAGIIFSEEDLPVGKLAQTTDNPICETQNSLKTLVEEKNEEKFSQSMKPEDALALDSVQSIQSPTTNSTMFVPEGIGTPEKITSDIAQNSHPESFLQAKLISLETHVTECLLKNEKSQTFILEPDFISPSLGFKLLSLDKTEQGVPYTENLQAIFPKDPGKSIEQKFESALSRKKPPECLSLPTHQVTQHQKLKPSKPPHVSHRYLRLSLSSLEDVGTKIFVNLIKQQINSTSIKLVFSAPILFPPLSYKAGKDNLQYILLLDQLQKIKTLPLHLFQTPSRKKSKVNRKRKHTRVTLGRYSSVSRSDQLRLTRQKSKRDLPFKSPNYRLRSLHWDHSGARKSIAKTLLVRFKNQSRKVANMSFAYQMLEVWRGARKADCTPAMDHCNYQICKRMVVRLGRNASKNQVQSMDRMAKKDRSELQDYSSRSMHFSRTYIKNHQERGFHCFSKDQERKTTRERSILLNYRLEKNIYWVRIQSGSSESIEINNSSLSNNHYEVFWRDGPSNRSSQRVVGCSDCLKSKEVDGRLVEPGIDQALYSPVQFKRALLGASRGQLHKHLIMMELTISKHWGYLETCSRSISMAATPTKSSLPVQMYL
jgi:hypothetical protein